MAGLQFRFRELLHEVKALRSIAREFLDPSTTWALNELESSINSLWGGTRGSASPLELHPLKTKISRGEFEIGGRRGGVSVVARITGKWDVRPIGVNSQKTKAKQGRLLEFCGLASTRIELFYSENLDHRIAMWRVELGADDAPGCYFHIQVLGEEDEPPFPKTVPVPRFPSLFVTPMGVIEYVLGELFQEQWARAAMGSSADLQFWRELQRERLDRLLEWQRSVLSDTMLSPWMALKGAKPDGKLFVR